MAEAAIRQSSSNRNPGTTPPIPGPHSIAEVHFLSIGNVDQWVMVRGKDKENPILIMLHGGPGMALENALWRYYNSEALEQVFTVVYWDQRGSGKSFDPKRIDKSTLTVEQYISDLDELVDNICRRLGHSKVTIFGHSWGSVLGPLYASRCPDKVAAYVGCGQLGNWAASEQLTFDYVLAEAEKRGLVKMAKELKEVVGPPPHTYKSLIQQRNCLSALDGDMDLRGLWNMCCIFVRVPEHSLWDLIQIYKVLEFSLDATWDEVTKIDLLERVPELKMPTFFLLGRQDHCVFPEISTEYIDALKAPSKEVVWFEHSKHLPFMDESVKFNDVMVNLVRPVVGSS